MKTKSKIIHIVIIFLLLSGINENVFSQEKKQEVSIATSTFDNFKLRYKFGNEKRLFRLTAGYLTLGNEQRDAIDYDVNEFRAGLAAGMEFPKQINDKLAFIYGFELGGSYNKTKEIDKIFYSVRGGGILGFSYSFNEVLKLGVELSPRVHYSSNREGDYTVEKFGFGLTSGFAEISLGFEF
jgi:hypothetical protein